MHNRKNIGASLLVALLLAGCNSSGGSGTSQTQPQAASNVVAGPWTGMATSTKGSGTSVVIANLTNQGSGNFFAASSDAQVCAQFHPECIESLPVESSGICCRYSVQGSTDGKGNVSLTINVLGADLNNTQLGTITVTGTLAGDGKSMTGTYASTYTNGTAPDAGNFTAALVKPITATYSGSLTSTFNGEVFPIAAALTEAGDGTISGSATISNSQCVSSITWTPTGNMDHSFEIGGGFHLWASRSTGYVYADVIPNGDGTYSVNYGINTTACSDTGRGTIK
jgi:hypothetical protein